MCLLDAHAHLQTHHMCMRLLNGSGLKGLREGRVWQTVRQCVGRAAIYSGVQVQRQVNAWARNSLYVSFPLLPSLHISQDGKVSLEEFLSHSEKTGRAPDMSDEQFIAVIEERIAELKT